MTDAAGTRSRPGDSAQSVIDARRLTDIPVDQIAQQGDPAFKGGWLNPIFICVDRAAFLPNIGKGHEHFRAALLQPIVVTAVFYSAHRLLFGTSGACRSRIPDCSDGFHRPLFA